MACRCPGTAPRCAVVSQRSQRKRKAIEEALAGSPVGRHLCRRLDFLPPVRLPSNRAMPGRVVQLEQPRLGMLRTSRRGGLVPAVTVLSRALHQAGAKYGSEHQAAFLRSLPFEQLKPHLDGELTVISAEFLPKAGLGWAVPARWHGPDAREADCTLSFEPFDGLPTTILRNSE